MLASTSLVTTLIVAGASIRFASDLVALTTTVSVRLARLSAMAGTSTFAAETTTSLRVAVAKPGSATVIRYVPLDTFRKLYSPLAPDVVVLLLPAGPVSVTVAPGTAAPDWSSTFPETVAV